MKPSEFFIEYIKPLNLKDGISELYLDNIVSIGETWVHVIVKVIYKNNITYERYIQAQQTYHWGIDKTGNIPDTAKREILDYIYRNLGLMTQHFNSGGLPAKWDKY